MVNSDYLKNLNKAQKEAVFYLDGPLLIVAGAGSGKTKVLTDRLLRLMLPTTDDVEGTKPYRILCLTFTKTGAAEMKKRIADTLREWSILDDLSLNKRLEKLLGMQPTPQQQVDLRRFRPGRAEVYNRARPVNFLG